MSPSLEEQIAKYLASHPGTRAVVIARHLDRSRREINSCLYTKRSRFRSEDSDPPVWFLLSSQSSVPAERETVVKSMADVFESTGITERRRRAASLVLTAIRENYPIRFSYKECSVGVQIVELSVNDPIAILHRLSGTEVTVEVNAHFLDPDVRADADALHLHVMHCVSDALVQFTLEETTTQEDVEDVLQIKSRILFSLMLEGCTEVE